MIVAGGVYLETCSTPASSLLMGSAGRAALALVGLTDRIRLHAFQPHERALEVYPNFEPLGIEVMLHPSPARIAFHYLYPLARPRISPVPLPESGTVEVTGKTVLRFGCLEGDFRVNAVRAVYDPQSAVAPSPFGQNGSRAERLAIVLNRAELRETARQAELESAARFVLERDGAEVVVVKSGPVGAYILARGEPMQHVPAFESRAVHKVGSGDIFSAAFTYYWASLDMPAAEAAKLASLHAADYVESRLLPLQTPPSDRSPMQVRSAGGVLVWASPVGASGRWIHDEAMSALRDIAPGSLSLLTLAEAGQPAPETPFHTVLILAQALEANAMAYASKARARGQAVVVYLETASDQQCRSLEALGCIMEADLATALYRATWA
jgi:hypothetical protein